MKNTMIVNDAGQVFMSANIYEAIRSVLWQDDDWLHDFIKDCGRYLRDAWREEMLNRIFEIRQRLQPKESRPRTDNGEVASKALKALHAQGATYEVHNEGGSGEEVAHERAAEGEIDELASGAEGEEGDPSIPDSVGISTLQDVARSGTSSISSRDGPVSRKPGVRDSTPGGRGMGGEALRPVVDKPPTESFGALLVPKFATQTTLKKKRDYLEEAMECLRADQDIFLAGLGDEEPEPLQVDKYNAAQHAILSYRMYKLYPGPPPKRLKPYNWQAGDEQGDPDQSSNGQQSKPVQRNVSSRGGIHGYHW